MCSSYKLLYRLLNCDWAACKLANYQCNVKYKTLSGMYLKPVYVADHTLLRNSLRTDKTVITNLAKRVEYDLCTSFSNIKRFHHLVKWKWRRKMFSFDRELPYPCHKWTMNKEPLILTHTLRLCLKDTGYLGSSNDLHHSTYINCFN